MEICRLKYTYKKTVWSHLLWTKIAEWLRRWNDNPLVSARVGSSPIFVVFLIGSIEKWIAICSLDSAIRIKNSVEESILKTSASTFMENLQKTK